MSPITTSWSIRTAAAGDGASVGDLAAVALGCTDPDPGKGLPAQIDAHGGYVEVPHGTGTCRVAADDKGVVGMVYTAPPVSWIEAHPAAVQPLLARYFTKVELLAVREEQREQGVGGALISAVETAERDRGAHLLFANVDLRDRKILVWYRRRGYTIAAPSEPIILTSSRGPLSLVDTGDGYLLAAKAIQPGCRLTRAQVGQETCLFVEQKRG
ncbi:GNAT family N-acetyltransferase [Streptomyces sp. WZ-12]|uniref:GNAT family N-acetyltransferase n=1 Tax=Streptomyces sp. WZ-12 TaxID=3030210 RepID=UPI0023817190|nr:GNAT family N-acetyltransferase [Streptomyces sp. WZ-12]